MLAAMAGEEDRPRPLGGAEQGLERADQPERGRDVDGEHPIPRLRLDVGHRRQRAQGGGRVHQHVDAAEALVEG
jgi:hypothetical protein